MKNAFFVFFIAGLFFCLAFSSSPRNVDGLTPLHVAAGYGNLPEVKKLIASGADIFALDSKMGVSVLHKAVYSGNSEVVDYLLQQGALIDLQSPSNGDTPLHDAIYFKSGNDLSVIRVLLSHNPTIAIKNRVGLTPLDAAKVLKDYAAVRLIESYINSKRTAIGKKLMQAVSANKLREVENILRQPGVNLEETDEEGFTPLLWASRQGYTEIVKLLLEKGANPNHEDQWMHATSGHKAAFWGHADVEELLIEHGLDINARGGYNGYTALNDAVSQSHVDVVKVLLSHHARVDIRGHDGKTALDIAKAKGNKEIMNLPAASSGVSR